MADMVKIKRKERIYLEEWILTVNELDNVRLCKEGFHTGKDADGKAFRVPVEEGDTEVYLEDQDKWINVFHYRDSEYCIAFDMPSGANEKAIWSVAREIANTLEARLIGDDGESYDADEPSNKAVTADGEEVDLDDEDDDDFEDEEEGDEEEPEE